MVAQTRNKNLTSSPSVQNVGNGRSQDVELGKTALLHLLSCTEKGRYRNSLNYKHVTHVVDDQQPSRTIG